MVTYKIYLVGLTPDSFKGFYLVSLSTVTKFDIYILTMYDN